MSLHPSCHHLDHHHMTSMFGENGAKEGKKGRAGQGLCMSTAKYEIRYAPTSRTCAWFPSLLLTCCASVCFHLGSVTSMHTGRKRTRHARNETKRDETRRDETKRNQDGVGDRRCCRRRQRTCWMPPDHLFADDRLECNTFLPAVSEMSSIAMARLGGGGGGRGVVKSIGQTARIRQRRRRRWCHPPGRGDTLIVTDASAGFDIGQVIELAASTIALSPAAGNSAWSSALKSASQVEHSERGWMYVDGASVEKGGQG